MNVVGAELVKLKRRKLWVLPILLLALLLLQIFSILRISYGVNYYLLYIQTYPVVFFGVTIASCILANRVFAFDFKNNVEKVLFTLPTAPSAFVFAKLSIVFFFCTLLGILSSFSILCVAIMSQIVIFVSPVDVLMVFGTTIIDCTLIYLSILPVICAFMLLKKYEVLSSLLILLYPLLLILATAGRTSIEYLNNIHPLMSAATIHNSIVYSYIPIEEVGITSLELTNPAFGVLNIMVCAIISIVIMVRSARTYLPYS